MQYLGWRFVLSAVVLGLVLVTVLQISSAARNDAGPVPQDAIRLEARINQLEQRLYSIESSVRTLEQQSRLGSVSPRGTAITLDDLNLLRSEIQGLQLRLADDECALAKLDERTLSPAARDARRKSATRSDPCRANLDTPVRLSDRRE